LFQGTDNPRTERDGPKNQRFPRLAVFCHSVLLNPVPCRCRTLRRKALRKPIDAERSGVKHLHHAISAERFALSVYATELDVVITKASGQSGYPVSPATGDERKGANHLRTTQWVTSKLQLYLLITYALGSSCPDGFAIRSPVGASSEFAEDIARTESRGRYSHGNGITASETRNREMANVGLVRASPCKGISQSRLNCDRSALSRQRQGPWILGCTSTGLPATGYIAVPSERPSKVRFRRFAGLKVEGFLIQARPARDRQRQLAKGMGSTRSKL
jgi:hypothetical protein